jgi:hypothetical protein
VRGTPSSASCASLAYLRRIVIIEHETFCGTGRTRNAQSEKFTTENTHVEDKNRKDRQREHRWTGRSRPLHRPLLWLCRFPISIFRGRMRSLLVLLFFPALCSFALADTVITTSSVSAPNLQFQILDRQYLNATRGRITFTVRASNDNVRICFYSDNDVNVTLTDPFAGMTCQEKVDAARLRYPISSLRDYNDTWSYPIVNLVPRFWMVAISACEGGGLHGNWTLVWEGVIPGVCSRDADGIQFCDPNAAPSGRQKEAAWTAVTVALVLSLMIAWQ